MSDEIENSVISPALRDFFENQNGELARVLVGFKFDDAFFRGNPFGDGDGDFDHEAILGVIKKESEKSQYEFLSDYDSEKNRIADEFGNLFFGEENEPESLPLANSLIITADKTIIDELDQRDEIAYVSIIRGITDNFDDTVNIEYEEETDKARYNSEEFPYSALGGFNHVLYLNTNSVWNAGYTGAGVVCAVIDGGVDFNHEKLVGKAHISSSSDYMDEHGTACASIIAGGSTKDAFPIGIAPDAKILGMGVDLDNPLMTLQAFQKAISLDFVDVISMSFQHYPPVNGDNIRPRAIRAGVWEYNDANPAGWRLACWTALQARKIHVVAAGNYGKICTATSRRKMRVPRNIGLPGRCPSPNVESGVSSAITIGATEHEVGENNKCVDTLILPSSVGPCNWMNTEFQDHAELVKPDLCAPGNSIVTASAGYEVHNNLYRYFGGTSGATAIVAGALCLLVQARRKYENDPTYKEEPFFYQRALEEGCVRIRKRTAQDKKCVGNPPIKGEKANGYGRGRLDIIEAFNWGAKNNLWEMLK